MAIAWSALENFFILQTRDKFNVALQVTLYSLQSLTNRCRALTQLCISLDTSALPVSPTLSNTPSLSLRNLVLLDSICGTVNDVATFLEGTFPHIAHLRGIEWLQNVHPRHQYPMQNTGEWVNVSSHMSCVEPWNVDFALRTGTDFDALRQLHQVACISVQ